MRTFLLSFAAAATLGPVPTADANGAYPCETEWIEVMFVEDAGVRLRDGVLAETGATAALAGVASRLAPVGDVVWSRICDVSEDRLDELHTRGEERAGTALYNLNDIYHLRIPAGHDPWEVARTLESLSGVRSARPLPLPPPAPLPPDYTASQGYARPATSSPVGIDADLAQTFPGGDGAGVTVCDLEYSWNYSHGDVTGLVGSQINLNVADPFNDPNHGTAVAGELVADANSMGITGLVPGATLLTCGTYFGAPNPVWNVPGALAVAMANLVPGDVILLEQQWDYTGSGGYVPIEWWLDYAPSAQTANAVWVAIRTAVSNGIHVVEAGGNGSVDTGALTWFTGAPYYSYSGAVIVGAGGAYAGGGWPQGDLERLSFSSWGPRFDLQGWGEDVMTTGYGTTYSADGANWYYTNSFSGTSSASPIVAAAIAGSVGYWKAQGRSALTLTPQDLRNHLVNTGTLQVNPGTGWIGPRPDLAGAFGILHTEWVESPLGPVSDPGDQWAMAWVDYDGDGDPDLHLLKPSGEANRLLRNDGGWNFVDVAAGPMADTRSPAAAAWADWDGDGDQDVFVANGQPDASRLLRNDGADSFAEVTPSFLQTHGVDAAWADTDLDGDLDLYLIGSWNGAVLARNDGGGSFTDVVPPALAAFGGRGCSWVDYDMDRDPDLYIHSFGANALFRNDGGAAFTNVTTAPLDDSGNTAGVAWGDFDNDGDLDLYLANDGAGNSNRLLRNDGPGTFADVTTPALADSTSWAKPGYSPSWSDWDNDGDLDLFLSNQGAWNRLWQNTGNGFVDAAPTIMAGYGGVSMQSRAAAWADTDGDGDLDLYVQHQQANSLFRNDNSHGAGWLHLDLRGTVSNRDGIGARIELTAGGQTQVREVTAGGSNHAQASRRVEFGLCANPAIDLIVIRWPSGTVDSLTSAGGPIAMNQVLMWVEGTGPVATDAPLPAFAEGPALRLYAGAPNPFSAGTAIRFDLPTSGPVRLRIYDVGGRLVRTLVDGVVPAGRGHTFRWDGRADSGGPVGAGVYFTRLEAGSRREAGRIVRIR